MVEIRTARKEEYQELIALLDDVFFRDDPLDFMSLLPKLYKEQYRPWESNYCVFEDGRMVAAVGMYIMEASCAGEPLRLGGIGNVAVARDCRRKGYMKLAMDAAVEAMAAKGCDYGMLSGLRQRYQYWGFERCGMAVSAHLTKTNLRHSFGDCGLTPGWRVSEILPGDSEVIAQAMALAEAAPLHIKHDPAAFYDILWTWKERPYAIFCGDKFAGFFKVNKEENGISALRLTHDTALEQALRAVFNVLPEEVSDLRVTIPLWEQQMLAQAEEIAEDINFTIDLGQFTVLNWQRTLQAMLKLQAQLKPLPEGTLRVNGFEITCKEGAFTVEACDGSEGVTLDHLTALRYFFAPMCHMRQSPLEQSWFPLPLILAGYDAV